jgi:hypothetical protein
MPDGYCRDPLRDATGGVSLSYGCINNRANKRHKRLVVFIELEGGHFQ